MSGGVIVVLCGYYEEDSALMVITGQQGMWKVGSSRGQLANYPY